MLGSFQQGCCAKTYGTERGTSNIRRGHSTSSRRSSCPCKSCKLLDLLVVEALTILGQRIHRITRACVSLGRLRSLNGLETCCIPRKTSYRRRIGFESGKLCCILRAIRGKWVGSCRDFICLSKPI